MCSEMEGDAVYFYEIIRKVVEMETKKFNLDYTHFSSIIPQVTSNFNENFDVGYNRCAFLFKYGTIYLCFFKHCISQFILECPESKEILSAWKDQTITTLSSSPGLDFFGFISAIAGYNQPNSLDLLFSNAKIFTKHGAWRNTVSFFTEVLQETSKSFDVKFLSSSNFTVTQDRSFSDGCSQKLIDSMKNSQVVLMMKALNVTALGSPQEQNILTTLKEIISSLKAETTLFFIDTKPSLALLNQVLLNFGGRFLYGPVALSFRPPATCLESLPEINGYHPIKSAKGVFTVWQKLPQLLSTNIPTISSNVLSTTFDEEDKSLASSSSIPFLDVRLNVEQISEIASPVKNSKLISNGSHELLNNITSEKTSEQSTFFVLPGVNPKSGSSLEDETVNLNDKNFVKLKEGQNCVEPEVLNDKDVLLNNQHSRHEKISLNIEPNKSELKNCSTSTPISDSKTKFCLTLEQETYKNRLVNKTNTLGSGQQTEIMNLNVPQNNNLFNGKVVQNDLPEDKETKHDAVLIKSLTERIRNLVTSFENIVSNQNIANSAEKFASLKLPSSEILVQNKENSKKSSPLDVHGNGLHSNVTECDSKILTHPDVAKDKSEVKTPENSVAFKFPNCGKYAQDASSTRFHLNTDERHYNTIHFKDQNMGEHKLSIPSGSTSKMCMQQLSCKCTHAYCDQKQYCDIQQGDRFGASLTPTNQYQSSNSHTNTHNKEMDSSMNHKATQTSGCPINRQVNHFCSNASNDCFIPSVCASKYHNYELPNSSCCDLVHSQMKYAPTSCCLSESRHSKLNCCPMYGHFTQCHSQLPCHIPRSETPRQVQHINPSVPNLVIPLENINQGVLAQLITALQMK